MVRILNNRPADLDVIAMDPATEVVQVERSHLTQVNAGYVLDVECADGRHVLVSMVRLDITPPAPAAPEVPKGDAPTAP